MRPRFGELAYPGRPFLQMRAQLGRRQPVLNERTTPEHIHEFGHGSSCLILLRAAASEQHQGRTSARKPDVGDVSSQGAFLL
jgi:hypothetical protein